MKFVTALPGNFGGKNVGCLSLTDRFSLAGQLLIASLLTIPALPVAAQAPIHLRAADIHDAGYPTVRGMQAMADRLAEATGDRALLRRAARDSVAVMRQLWDERVMASREAIEAAGVNIVDDIDKQPFIDAVQPLYDEYLRDPALRSLVERIGAVR